MANEYPPDYYQNGFPVLSFAYALYTDQEFMNRETQTWREAHGQNKDYRGYLDKYRHPHFPKRSENVIAVDVERNGPDSELRYFPTPNQARTCIEEMFREITTAPPAPRPPNPRIQAELAGDRPVLRVLAVLFLNEPPTPAAEIAAAIDALPLAPPLAAKVKPMLTRFITQKPAEFNSGAEAKALADALVDEFCKTASVW